MPLSDYKLTINVHDVPTLGILNDAPYKLRVGNPPPPGPKVFESPTNKIPFSFLQDGGSDDALVLKTIVTLTFTAQGWVYSIGYKLPGEDSTTGLHDEQDITHGQVYVVPKTGAVETPRAKGVDDGFVTDQVFGVSNAKTVALALSRRPGDAAAGSPSTLVEQYPAWFPGFGAIPRPTDGDSSAPGSIYVWFETHLHGAQHEVTGVTVPLGDNPELALYVHSDGTIANAQEQIVEGATEIATPLNKQGGNP